MTHILELSADFISDYYYTGTKTHYLRSNVYQKMLEKADTEEKKKRIQELYPHLATKNQSYKTADHISESGGGQDFRRFRDGIFGGNS